MDEEQNEDEGQNEEDWLTSCAQVMGKDLGNCWGLLYRELGELQREAKYTRNIYRQNDVIDLLNRSAPDFFGLVQTLLHHSIALRIGRLIDSDRASVSLYKLATLACADANQLKPRLSEIMTAAAQVQVWRNKVIAHNDLKVALGGGPDVITWDKIDVILQKTEECLQIVGARYNFSTGSPYNLTDAKALIAILRLGLEERDKQLLAENLRFDLG